MSAIDIALNGAEPIRCETLRRFSEAFAVCGFRPEALTPVYGLSESTLLVSLNIHKKIAELPKFLKISKNSLAIGEAIVTADESDAIEMASNGPAESSAHQVIIVDPASFTLKENNTVGEIWIRSASVTQGYWQRPDESQHTFSGRVVGQEETYLRTGDLGFIDHHELYIAGRIKEMMIFNGRNIYPRDVEVTIERIDPAFRISGCAAFSIESANGPQLVVVQEVEPNKEAQVDVLANSVRAELVAQHGISNLLSIVLVKTGGLPRTASGKIQRVLCAKLFASNTFASIWQWTNNDAAQACVAIGYVAPQTETERVLCGIWQELLAVDQVGVEDNFLALGGHSLLATQVFSRLRAAFQIDLPLRALFEAPTVRALAQHIEQARQAGPPQAPAIELADRQQALPLSFAQQRMWFLDQFESGSTFYNIPAAVRLVGQLSVSALQATLNEIVRRHEALRTSFTTLNGIPVQVVAAQLKLDLPLTELAELPTAERQAKAQWLTQVEAHTPFELATGPLIRARLIRLSQTEHIALLTMHHIVSDGWSMGVLINEVAALYSAYVQDKPSPLPELGIQYPDYAQWQRRWLSGAELQRQSAYWRTQLANGPTLLNLPTDRPRPMVQSYRGASLNFEIEAATTAGLKTLARQSQCTLFMTLLSGFNVLLSRYSVQNDICVGSPIANRNRAELEPLIGFFVNTLVLRSQIDHDSGFDELLAQVRATTLDAYTHQDLPFEQLVEALNPERHTSHAPLFQVMLVLQNMAISDLKLPGLTLESVASDNMTAQFDLTLSFTEVGEHLDATLEYNIDLFDAATIQGMAGHLTTLFAAIVENPASRIQDLQMLSESERQQLLCEWNDTAAYPQERCFHELFEAQAARTPENMALVFEDKQLDYAALNARANQLAHYLRSQGVGPDVLVGICVERSMEMVVGLLAILKAGGAYVPLDPGYPSERIAYILNDAKPLLLLTQQHLQPILADSAGKLETLCLDSQWANLASYSTANLDNLTLPGNLAYVIYTSGSTGKPKGVLTLHHGVVNIAHSHLDNIYRPFNKCHMRGSFNAPYVFDASVSELILLLDGHTLFIIPEEVRLSPARLLNFVSENRLDAFDCSPSQLKYLLEQSAGHQLPGIVLFGGEAIDADLWQKLKGITESRFFNVYGPTECTIDVSICPVQDGPDKPAIGRPEANIQLYLLDERLNPVPIGVAGELHIGGAGLARGYLNRAGLTADKFIPNPFSATPGARMYKSGDLARYLPDGNIEYLGRIDDQVKIRGFRIELGEIEAALAALPEVRDVVVLAREDNPGDKRLVAYLVAREAGVLPQSAELREHLKQSLPDYMVPAHFVTLQSLPVTLNGKIDRKTLPAPDMLRSVAGYVAPSTATEVALAQIWADVLKLDKVGSNDNFFELGGHSLLMTQVAARLRETFDVELSLRTLFDVPQLNALSAVVDLARRDNLACVIPPLVVLPRPAHLPLSYAQERLWLLEQIEAVGSAYNIAGMMRFVGVLDDHAFEQALGEIVRRHEPLRTRFVAGDETVEQVIAAPGRFVLERLDLSSIDAETRLDEANRASRHVATRRFDLTEGSLFHVALLRLAPEEHIVVIVMHHIVSDGWSLGVLIRELGALYAAFSQDLPSPLPALPVQYADYAVWQRNWLQGEVLQEQLDYWTTQLVGAPGILDLPTDRSRPALQSFRGASCRVALPRAESDSLNALARKEGVTLYMVLLAAFNVVLSRWSGQDDIVVGTPIANRTQSETEGLIGFFVNTLAIRTDLSAKPTFTELLGRVREAALGAYAHQDLPFEKLVEALQLERDLSRSPIFQAMFILQNTQRVALELPGLTLSLLEDEAMTAKFELTLSMEETAQGLTGVLEYATDLFDRETIERLLGHLMTLLKAVISDPNQSIAEIALMGDAERQQVLEEWNATVEDYPQEQCLHELFEAQVRNSPDAIAVVYEQRQLSYAELNAQANQLAHYLQSLGVGPESVVGLCVDRSLEMVVGLLGILKAGGAYLPLDPHYPSERLAYMLADAQVEVLVTQSQSQSQSQSQPVVGLSVHTAREVCLDRDWAMIGQCSTATPPSGTHPKNLAYVMYTSGSTGKPKGVMVVHQSLVNFLSTMQRQLKLSSDEILAAVTPISFDISGLELYLPLLVGARVVVVDRKIAADGKRLAQMLETIQATVLQATPATWHMLLEAGWQPGKVKVLCGGEALPQDMARVLAEGTAEVWNLYGPTETTIWSTTRRLNAECHLSIGSPLGNTQVYVVDGRFEAVPVGVAGELCIGGAGLARGYWNRPDLTAERFVPNPFGDGGRLYRTGDLARWRADGQLEYLGRIDQQVKIRGFRVELGEIEAALQSHNGIVQAVVMVREDNPGDQRLVAYLVVREAGVVPPSAELRALLLQSLPDYMVPAIFLSLETLPLTPNGKIDRRALPAPEGQQLRADYAAPSTPKETLLAGIFAEVLGLERVGAQDDFFALGGHSLLVMQLVSRVRKVFDIELPLRSIFEAPTVAELTAQIDSLENGQRLHLANAFLGLGSNSDIDQPNIIKIQNGYSAENMFFIHPAGGGIPLEYRQLAKEIGPSITAYGITALDMKTRTLPPGSIQEMARSYVTQMQVIQATGPYFIIGYSAGGLIAFEMARQLSIAGETIGLLSLIDTYMDAAVPNLGFMTEELEDWAHFIEIFGRGIDALDTLHHSEADLFWSLSETQKTSFFLDVVHANRLAPKDLTIDDISYVFNVFRSFRHSRKCYNPEKYKGEMDLFLAKSIPINAKDGTMLFNKKANVEFWQERTNVPLRIVEVNGDHATMMEGNNVREISNAIAEKLTEPSNLLRQ